jgi:hypothetical protein
MKGETGDEGTSWETEHGNSADGFSEATQDAFAKARNRLRPPRRVEVILQEFVEASPEMYHVIVRFPTN